MNYTHYWNDGAAILSESVEYEAPAILAEQAGAEAYAKDIRGAALQAWLGLALDASTIMWDTVGLGIAAAWRDGAATCGISEDELSHEEKMRRDEIIREQRNYIPDFLNWVYAHRRDGPDKLLWRDILPRTVLWANAWDRTYNEAMVRACSDQKIRWVLHGERVTKEPCRDCLRLDGRIYRSSIWAKYEIYPKVSTLACGGWRCGCSWGEVGADEKVTPGRPPSLAGQR